MNEGNETYFNAVSIDKLVWKNKEGKEIGKRRVGKECRSRWSPYH